MAKRKRSPQEKKVLSYTKDRRNTFAEMRSIAHRAISKRKAMANQALRAATRKTVTKQVQTAADPEAIDVFVPRTGSRSWRKSPDAPLANYLESKIESRPRRGNSSRAKASPLLGKARRATLRKRGW
jgi:hypothetical protein